MFMLSIEFSIKKRPDSLVYEVYNVEKLNYSKHDLVYIPTSIEPAGSHQTYFAYCPLLPITANCASCNAWGLSAP